MAFRYLTEESFDEGIRKGLVLVDFYAEWCGPCRRLTPVLEKVAESLQDKLNVFKLDIDASQKTAAALDVHSFPTLILFKNGKEIGRLIGLRDEETVKNFILNS